MPLVPGARLRRAACCALLAAGLGGCGSLAVDELPPAAGPAASPPLSAEPAGRVLRGPAAARYIRRMRMALQRTGVTDLDGGRKFAVLAGRERVLELYDATSRRRIGRVPAGTGPTHVVSDGGRYLYVVDTVGNGLLVYDTVPELRPTRRYPLAGAPYAAAFDRVPGHRRIWVTLTATNELAELAAGARPHLLRRFPSVRQPDRVAVVAETGRVVVAGRAQGVVQLLDPPPLERRR